MKEKPRDAKLHAMAAACVFRSSLDRSRYSHRRAEKENAEIGIDSEPPPVIRLLLHLAAEIALHGRNLAHSSPTFHASKKAVASDTHRNSQNERGVIFFCVATS